ncbi:MAG: NADH-quinone oxidoreductase subunit H [Phycisphaerae bacterium]
MLPLLAFGVSVLFLGASRKVTARIQRRYGPPLYQPVIDVVKLLAQQENVSHGVVFDAGVMLALGGSIATALFIPVGGFHPLSASGDLLVVLYLMLLAPLGLALAAGASENPNASIGVSRKLILALGYEVPFLLALLAVMMRGETTSLVEITRLQQASVLGWGLFRIPLSALAVLLVLPAMLGLRPFDMATAPQEIASGPLVEFGGKYLAVAALQGALHSYIVIALFVDIFLGGGANVLTFLVKMAAVFFGVLLVNAVYPRVRIGQALRFCWTWPTLVALVGLIVAVWMRG